MRLRQAALGGVAVILALWGGPQQAFGAAALQDTAAAGQRRGARDTLPPVVQDTLPSTVQDTSAAVQDTLAVADSLAQQDSAVAPPPSPRLKIGLKEVSLPLHIDLAADLPDPTRQRPELRQRVSPWGEVWAEAVRERIRQWESDYRRQNTPIIVVQRIAEARALAEAEALAAAQAAEEQAVPEPVDTLPPEPLPEAETDRPELPDPTDMLPDVFRQYADLGLAVQGRVELGGGWNRFEPCNVSLALNCDPSLIPTLKPDIQFGARVGGTISDRIHVSVDYDNRREFDAANNINVFYQGLEDEILQRVEVGDVGFQLPQSRYLTQGIPAGNFGFRTTGQMGPIDFQAVWAQQKGDVGVRELQLGGRGQGFEQTAVTILDDADYERGRFFFLFNPRGISGHPDIDIQRLIAPDAPPELQPGSVVKVYRYEVIGIGIGAQVPEGFITAVAGAVDTLQTELGADTVVADTLTGLFRPLIDGEDYVLHRSGLWIQLRNTLRETEGLAITYIASDGTEIGTFDAEAQSDAHNADPDNVPPPTLELIKGLNQRPGTATWSREMHHIYRVSASSGVVESSVEFTISQGDPEVGNTFRTADTGEQVEFIKIFGLDDDPTDNQLDVSQLYEASGGTQTAPGPAGAYIVFPTLEPFRKPPPLKDVPGLSGDPFPLEPGDVNGTIYEEPNDGVRRGSNLYLLTASYRQRFEGFLSTISLGAGGVREASERVIIDETELVRGEDYTIDYDVGQVELREPERWFSNNPNARIRVTFEQKPLFQLAPTTVFGLQARYGLGQAGELNLIGLSQTEKTLQTRPELGLEPSAVRLGGLSGRLNFRPDWLTGLANALPGVRTEAPSSVALDGEIAVSLPTTNTQGVTYVEDFEGGPGFQINLLSRAWRLASAPSTTAGAEPIAPPGFGLENAAELVWQDQYTVQTTEGTIVVGGLLPGEIDSELLIQGTQRTEPVLTVTARLPEDRQLAPNPNPPAVPAWRSITSVISSAGQDFTNIEFLEFYVAVSDALADSTNLIIDLGTVSEDAFAIDSLGMPSGLGQLNREVDPPKVWSNADDVGLWGTGCEANARQIAYPLGSANANCTRNNGLDDTEDLNQNQILDSEDRFFRYTVKVGDPSSPYFVRFANEIAGGVRFRLFRIPLRKPDHRERVTDAEFQNIRHLRLTWVTESNNRLILARTTFIGSRWLKRGGNGVVEGLADSTTAVTPDALVEVGPVSTVDPRYIPPPGVTDQVANQADQFGFGSQSFNEQSLSIRFTNVGPNERAEVYLQYVQTPRDFLAYRTLSVWALGFEGPWGRSGQPLDFVVKLGENANNFYMYKTPLTEVPPSAGGSELREAWLPEIHIDFDRFIALRTSAEEVMLRADGLPGDTTLTVWDVDVFEDGDSSYAVVIGQRSRAPNLAAIRQISLGAYNSGSDVTVSGELWVDDMRLATAVDNTGLVGQFSLDVRGSDLFGLRLSYSSANPYFRQLAQDPSFRSSSTFALGGNIRLGQMLPDSWGINLPLNVSYNNASSQPLLLPRTDIFVDQLPGLRTPSSKTLRLDMSLSKLSTTTTPWVGWFVDNSSLRLSLDRRTSRTSRSSTEASGLAASYSFRSNVGDLSLPLIPGTDWRLRLTPVSFQFSTNYTDSESDTRRFEEIIELPEDSAAVPVSRFDERLLTNASMNFAPLSALTGRFLASQARELVPTHLLVTGRAARELIASERSSMFGIDTGWETGRTLDMNWSYRPNIATWFIPQATLDTRYRFNRGASFVTEQQGDTVLTSDFNNSRSVRLSAGFNAPVLLRSVIGQDAAGAVGAIMGVVDWLDLLSASWSGVLSSRYQRETARPDLSYQFGLGGFESFKVQDGDTASRVSDSDVLTLSSGLRLPVGAAFSFDYSKNNAFTWTPISQSKNRGVSWPSVSFNWSRFPLPNFLSRWVTNLSFRTGYTVSTSRSDVLDADQTRTNERKSIPFNVSLQMTTEWTFSYNMTSSDDERRDPTGITLGDSRNQSLQVTGRVRPIKREGSFRNPVRISLRLSQNDQNQCRQLGGAFAEGPPEGGEELPACEPFTDRTIKTVDLTVATDVPPFSLGLQGSWRDTQSQIGQRAGSTQLEISIFGQFLLETGEIR